LRLGCVSFFCEKNVMALLVKIVKQKCAPAVHTQVIQTISILVQNVRNNTSLYYLLSNNYINEIIDNDFDFRDEELQDHFVSFLKTLSLRLNPNTVQFFFNQETHTFPLLTRAISYVTSPEAMIRVAVQTIILNVYKGALPFMAFFVCALPPRKLLFVGRCSRR
jgi:protein CLEC16A